MRRINSFDDSTDIETDRQYMSGGGVMEGINAATDFVTNLLKGSFGKSDSTESVSSLKTETKSEASSKIETKSETSSRINPKSNSRINKVASIETRSNMFFKELNNKNYERILRIITRERTADMVDPTGKTVLHYLSKDDSKESIKCLKAILMMSFVKDIINRVDMDKNSALHIAAMHSNDDAGNLLVDAGIDQMLINNNGERVFNSDESDHLILSDTKEHMRRNIFDNDTSDMVNKIVRGSSSRPSRLSGTPKSNGSVQKVREPNISSISSPSVIKGQFSSANRVRTPESVSRSVTKVESDIDTISPTSIINGQFTDSNRMSSEIIGKSTSVGNKPAPSTLIGGLEYQNMFMKSSKKYEDSSDMDTVQLLERHARNRRAQNVERYPVKNIPSIDNTIRKSANQSMRNRDMDKNMKPAFKKDRKLNMDIYSTETSIDGGFNFSDITNGVTSGFNKITGMFSSKDQEEKDATLTAEQKKTFDEVGFEGAISAFESVVNYVEDKTISRDDNIRQALKNYPKLADEIIEDIHNNAPTVTFQDFVEDCNQSLQAFKAIERLLSRVSGIQTDIKAFILSIVKATKKTLGNVKNVGVETDKMLNNLFENHMKGGNKVFNDMIESLNSFAITKKVTNQAIEVKKLVEALVSKGMQQDEVVRVISEIKLICIKLQGAIRSMPTLVEKVVDKLTSLNVKPSIGQNISKSLNEAANVTFDFMKTKYKSMSTSSEELIHGDEVNKNMTGGSKKKSSKLSKKSPKKSAPKKKITGTRKLNAEYVKRSMSELHRTVVKQNDTIHKDVIKTIMEIMNVDEDTAKTYKSGLWDSLKKKYDDEEWKSQSQLQKAVELQKITTESNLKKIDLKKAKAIRDANSERSKKQVGGSDDETSVTGNYYPDFNTTDESLDNSSDDGISDQYPTVGDSDSTIVDIDSDYNDSDMDDSDMDASVDSDISVDDSVGSDVSIDDSVSDSTNYDSSDYDDTDYDSDTD